MKTINIIFGGFKLSKKVLNKYSKIYKEPTIIIPLTIPCLIFRQYYSDYKRLNSLFKLHDDVHIHVMSGSCHYLFNFLENFPKNKSKIKSQIFDSPCHALGISTSLNKIYGIPNYLTKKSINTLFNNCVYTSNEFMKKPIIKNIPTGIIISNNDLIAPKKYTNLMINNWDKTIDINIMKTNSKHLESFKDNPIEYEEFCNFIKFKNLKN